MAYFRSRREFRERFGIPPKAVLEWQKSSRSGRTLSGRGARRTVVDGKAITPEARRMLTAAGFAHIPAALTPEGEVLEVGQYVRVGRVPVPKGRKARVKAR